MASEHEYRGSVIDVGTKKGYDIACALRGPDMPIFAWLDYEDLGRAFKLAFTAHIRGIVGASGGVIRHTDLAAEEAEMLRAALMYLRINCTRENRAAVGHYLGHVEDAALALGDSQLAELAWRCLSYLRNDEDRLPTIKQIIRMAGGG